MSTPTTVQVSAVSVPVVNVAAGAAVPVVTVAASAANGANGVDGGFEVHDFTGSPSTSHQITHSLGYYPNVAVTVSGVIVVAEIEYVNATRIDVRTTTATEPIVYLS